MLLFRGCLAALLLGLLGCEKAEEPLLYQATGEYAASPKVIFDTDTANEIDDLYAMARLFPDTSIEVLGINSAQWFHHYSGDSSVYASQRLNEELLEIAGLLDWPHPLGSDSIMGDPWGGFTPRPNPASQFIIDQVKALPEGEKLVVMSIGALTNLAIAIRMDTTIAPQIVSYSLGLQYYPERGGYWSKSDFNVRRDLNATNYCLNRPDLEMHVLPVNVAREYQWPREDVFERLTSCGDMGDYLRQKWLERFGDFDTWIMWDVALLQAFLHPEMATEEIIDGPVDNPPRRLYVYTDIDYDAMYADYWSTVSTAY
ncbi:MAG: nucleoside hydrolase [Bacteroidota bacterium]